MIKRDERKRGMPGIDLVTENLEEEMIGREREKIVAFWRPMDGHRLGCIKRRDAKGRLQKRVVEREERGLIAGSKEVNRSGVILGSTREKLSS